MHAREMKTGNESQTARAEIDNESRRRDLKKILTKAMKREARRQRNAEARRNFFAPYFETLEAIQ